MTSPQHTQNHSPRDTGVERRAQRSRHATRTHRLLAKAHRSRGERRERLEKEVAILNMDMARSVASRYWGRGEPSEDLAQVAYVGLMKAIHGFDPHRGDEFRSYAIPTIAGEVKRHFRDKSWTVKAPRWIQELQADISAVSDGLTQELQRTPRPAETAERLGVPEEKVNEALSADGCFTPTSIDGRGPTGDGYALADRLGDQDRDLDRAEIRMALAPLVRDLSERDRKILDLRFFRGWTQSQIAADLGVTQMQVSRLLSRILKNLRTELTAA
jgi:RNA polymerase sigma-B factor